MTTTRTVHFRFGIPDFTTSPWHEDFAQMVHHIDSVVYSAIFADAVVWDNSTIFAEGAKAFDPTDGTLWLALVSHTSAALPTTFAQDRAANPTYWVEIQGAGEAIDIAYDNTGTDLLATNVQDAITELDDEKVAKAGDTMTGALVVAAALAAAFVVGPNGATNPTFVVDTSVASAATGVKAIGRAAGAGASLVVNSSGTNEALTIDSKGSGEVTLNATGTGNVRTGRNFVPVSNDGASIGVSGTAFSDIYLATGAVIDWGTADVTVTHSANALAFTGASSGYSFDALVVPATNNAVPLGSGALSFSDLFLGSGAVVNFDNGDYVLTHSSDLLTITGGKLFLNLGGGTLNATPSPGLTISANAGANPAPNNTTADILHLIGVDGAQTSLSFDAIGSNNTFRFKRANGVTGALTALASGDSMGSFNGYGHDGSAYTQAKVQIVLEANEAWTSTNNGTRIRITVTPNASTTQTEVMRLTGTQASIALTTASTSTTTGALIVSGGLGVAGSIHGKNITLTATNSTPLTITADSSFYLSITTNDNSGNCGIAFNTKDAGGATKTGYFLANYLNMQFLAPPAANLQFGENNGAGSINEALRLPHTTQAVLAMSPTGGLGYGTGAGGTVTQITSKSTGVTLNKVCGEITMHNATLNAGTSVGFTLTNSAIAAADTIVAVIAGAASANSYNIDVTDVAAGSCRIQIRNFSAGNLSEALVLNFAVIKAVTS